MFRFWKSRRLEGCPPPPLDDSGEAARGHSAGSHPSTSSDGDLAEHVAALIAEFRPLMQADGGDLELVEVRGGLVRVRLKGACAGCPSAFLTLQMGLERYLRERLPEVVAVESV